MAWSYPQCITEETTSKKGALVCCVSSLQLALIRYFFEFYFILFIHIAQHFAVPDSLSSADGNQGCASVFHCCHKKRVLYVAYR